MTNKKFKIKQGVLDLKFYVSDLSDALMRALLSKVNPKGACNGDCDQGRKCNCDYSKEQK
jgi:hypothetical protein